MRGPDNSCKRSIVKFSRPQDYNNCECSIFQNYPRPQNLAKSTNCDIFQYWLPFAARRALQNQKLVIF